MMQDVVSSQEHMPINEFTYPARMCSAVERVPPSRSSKTPGKVRWAPAPWEWPARGRASWSIGSRRCRVQILPMKSLRG